MATQVRPMSRISEEIQARSSLSLAPYFVDFVKRIDPDADPIVLAATDMVIRSCEDGNVCFPLPENHIYQVGCEKSGPAGCQEKDEARSEVVEKLLASKVVGRPGEIRPLVLDQAHRLYLYRYWKYENELAVDLLVRAQEKICLAEYEQISSYIDLLFSEPDSTGANWQKIAGAVAILKKFCVICGGPGTGKTATVVKIMALLLQASGGRQLKFGLVAPTGKAAARLQDSIKNAKRSLKVPDDVVVKIPEEVQTIHRLLGYCRNSPYFRHNAKNPLDLDVLIVDEASMVDLALMAKLFSALSEHCRIILLGDKDQLASVEAGRVLGDICRKDTNGFSQTFAAQLKELGVDDQNEIGIIKQSGFADSIVILEKSYRFDAESGIGNLAKAINSANFDDVSHCLSKTELADIYHNSMQEDEQFKALIHSVCDECSDYLQCLDPKEAFALFERFRLLCVHRKGLYGAQMLNSFIEEKLAQKGLISVGATWYAGRPILITQNDYNLGLFNGDTGVTLLDEAGELRVFFLGPQGEMRSLSPLRIPAHETAFAVTVHKSQGSEFEHVALLLPEEPSLVLCRELLYTAVTRARKKFTLWGDMAVVKEGLAKTIQRSSGLADKLETGN